MLDQFHSPVLVIVAHPDDIEAHCAGTVARLIESGQQVTYILVTSGNRGTHDPNVTADAIESISNGLTDGSGGTRADHTPV